MRAVALVIASLAVLALANTFPYPAPRIPANLAGCTATTSLSTTLKVVGLPGSETQPCISTTIQPSTAGLPVPDKQAMFPIDFTGLDQEFFSSFDISVLVWNHNRWPTTGTSRTEVSFSGGGASVQARGWVNVDASGAVTGVTITNRGAGYTSAPACSISTANAHMQPTVSAVCRAVICKQGTVTGVVIDVAGSGYPPGGPVWNDGWFNKLQVQHITNNMVTGQWPSLSTTSLMNAYPASGEKNKDSQMCDCYDVWAAACSCVQVGYSASWSLGAANCDQQYSVVIDTIVPVDLSVMVVATPKTGGAGSTGTMQNNADLYSKFWDTLPVGVATDFVAGFSQVTNFKVTNPGGINPARRWLSELRVTLSTPLSENWFCTSNPWAVDCAVRSGSFANATVDTAHVSAYNTAPIVMIGPPTRAIQSVTVTNAGSGYVGRVTITASRTPPPNSDKLASITVLNGGSGYTGAPPTVSFSFGNAKASAVTDANGVITSITITDAGSGYGSSPPSVIITPRTEISQVVLTNCGQGYSANLPPAVYIAPSPFGFAPAYAYATVDGNGAISGITMIQKGSGYDVNSPPTVIIGKRLFSINVLQPGVGYVSCTPVVTITCNGGCVEHVQRGQPAKGTANIQAGSILNINITSYSVFTGPNPVVTIDDGDCTPTTQATATVTMSTTGSVQATGKAIPVKVVGQTASAVATTTYQYGEDAQETDAQFHAVMSTDTGCDLGGALQSVQVVDGGSGYSASTTFGCSGSGGSGCAVGNPVVTTGTQATATASVTADGLISGFTVTNQGAGYTCPPTVTLMTLGRLTSLRVLNPGFGYTAPPIVTIAGGDGSATATASIDSKGRVTGLTLGNPGLKFSYGSQPAITFGPRYEIISVALNTAPGSCGSGYTTAPTVCIVHPTGYGAVVTATVANGEVTGFVVVNGGQGYNGATPTVQLIHSGTGTGASAVVTKVGNSLNSPAPVAAQADGIWEHGLYATAAATVDSTGKVSGINIVKNAAPFYDLWGTTPYNLPNLGSSSLGLMPVFSSGFLTGYTITSRDLGTANTNLNNAGSATFPKVTTYFGGGTADATGSGSDVGLLSASTQFTNAVPLAWVEYNPTSKVYHYYDVAPIGVSGSVSTAPSSNTPFWVVSPQAPPSAAFGYFPNNEFGSNTQLSGALNTLMLKSTVKVETFEYLDLTAGPQTATIVRGGRPVRFQVPVTPNWSRIWLSYSFAAGTIGYETVDIKYYTTSNTGVSGALSYDKARGILAKSAGSVLVPSNQVLVPIIVEFVLKNCQAASMVNSLSVTVSATVTNFKDFPGGECNHYLDCTRPVDGHPSSKSGRASRSVNGDATRFQSCQVDADDMTGKCMECSSEVDCNFGQYCHRDTGMCTMALTGVKFNCDNSSQALFGTCQPKDPNGDILGKPCRIAASNDASVADLWRPMDQAASFVEKNIYGYCGRNLYYNDSYYDAAWLSNSAGFANRTRVALWSGYCVNQMCMECTEGQTMSSSAEHKICVDGKWQFASGSLTFGQLSADAKATRDAVTKGTAVSSSMLAFVIVISIVTAIVLFCYLKGGSRGGKSGGTEMGRA